MSRLLRPVAVSMLAVAALALTACGGDSGGDSSYEKDAKATVLAVRAAGDKLGTVLENASSQTDAALTSQLEAVQTQTAAALAQIKALDPPDDKAQKLVDALATAFAKANTDVVKLTDAATANDPTGARSATEQLVKDSPAVKAANNALGLSVGVPARKETTPTTPATPNGDPAAFNTAATAVVNRVAQLGTTVEGIIKGAGDQTDAALAKQLADAEDEAAASITDLKALQAPTAKDQTLVDNLNTALQAIDSDLGSLSSSVAAHNVDAAKAGTRQLLTDAPAVAKANNALAAVLGGE